MEEEKKETPADHGKRLASWTFPEYQDHTRGRWWYIIMSAIILGLLIYSITTKNYLFAVILALASFIYIARMRLKPRLISLTVTEDGLEVHETFYAYKDIKKFWIIYQPPEVKTLYVEFTSGLKPLLAIPLEIQNPLVLREILLRYVREDLEKDEEIFSDALRRRLKL